MRNHEARPSRNDLIESGLLVLVVISFLAVVLHLLTFVLVKKTRVMTATGDVHTYPVYRAPMNDLSVGGEVNILRFSCDEEDTPITLTGLDADGADGRCIQFSAPCGVLVKPQWYGSLAENRFASPNDIFYPDNTIGMTCYDATARRWLSLR